MRRDGIIHKRALEVDELFLEAVNEETPEVNAVVNVIIVFVCEARFIWSKLETVSVDLVFNVD